MKNPFNHLAKAIAAQLAAQLATTVRQYLEYLPTACVTIKPSDVLIFKTKNILRQQDIDKMKGYTEQAFPGTKCVILDEGTDFLIATPEPNTNLVEWKPITDLPDYTDFVWVERPGGVSLAYFNPCGGRHNQFQVAKTAGDAEGLSIEYYTDVIRWAELQEPTAP